MPRLLVNREKAGELTPEKRAVGYTRGFDWGPTNYRCAAVPCTAGSPLARLLPGRPAVSASRPAPPLPVSDRLLNSVPPTRRFRSPAPASLPPSLPPTPPLPSLRAPRRRRDALFLGDCDDGVRRLCALLGWEAELDALIAAGQQQLRGGQAGQAAAAAEQAPGGGGSSGGADAATAAAASAQGSSSSSGIAGEAASEAAAAGG